MRSTSRRARRACLVVVVVLGALAPQASAVNVAPTCYVTRFEATQGVRITPMNQVSASPGETVRLDWHDCGGDGLALAGSLEAARGFAEPRIRRVRVEQSVGGYIAFGDPPSASAHDWPIRFVPEPDQEVDSSAVKLVRAWNVDVDVPVDVEPGSYYAAVEFDQTGDESAAPLVAFLAVDVRSAEHDDAWHGVEGTLTSSVHDGMMRFDYVVDNDGAYTAEVDRRFVDVYSLFDRLPKREAKLVETHPDPSEFSALVPRNGRRTFRFDSADPPVVSCAPYIARYKPGKSAVRTLTTLRLPWGAYTRRSNDVDDCDGILANPVGLVVLGAIGVAILSLAVAAGVVSRRMARRRRQRRATA